MIPTIAQIIATHQPDTRPDNSIDGVGNIYETAQGVDVEVEFPVWVLPRIDQTEVEQ